MKFSKISILSILIFFLTLIGGALGFLFTLMLIILTKGESYEITLFYIYLGYCLSHLIGLWGGYRLLTKDEDK